MYAPAQQPKRDLIDTEALASVFEKYPQILAVYLFGSTAVGGIHAESDLDLALVPGDSGLKEVYFRILTDVVAAGWDDVSLVILDEDIDIVLKSEAVQPNRVIYQRPEFDRGAYYSSVLREYFDFLPYILVQEQAYKERVLGG